MKIRALCVLALASACSGAAGSSGIGHVDPRFLSEAAERQGAYRAEIYTNASGAMDKLELYHRDPRVIPEAVMHLTNEKFPGAKVENYESELGPEGVWIYEMEVTATDGRRCELSSSAEGQLRYIECQLAAAELPQPVTQSVTDHVPGGAIVEAERRQGDGVDQFRIESKLGDVVHYLIYDVASGQLQQHDLKIPAVLSVPAK